MADEQTNDRNDRGLKTWAPLAGLGLCVTWIIFLAATQLRDGGTALTAESPGWLDSFLLAPVKSLGITGSYLLLLCLASLCYLVWTRRRVQQVSRRVVGLPFLLLALSCLSALAEGDGNLWGGFLGGVISDTLLAFGKPAAIVFAMLLLGFGLIMARDWFFFDDIRRLISGGRAAPAFALGMGGAPAGPGEHQDSARNRRGLQVGIEPMDDLERSLDFAPLPMASGLTTLAPNESEEDEDSFEDDSDSPRRLGSGATGGADGELVAEARAGVIWSQTDLARESSSEESDPLLTRSLTDRKKLPEIDTEIGSDEALEDFLAEDRQEDDADDSDVDGELPELDWSRTVDERSDADLFADLAVNELVATDVADSGKEPEMFAVTEAPIQDQPKLGWDDDTEEVDWEDSETEYSDDDDDYEDDEDDEDDDDDDDDEDDDEEEDDEDDEDEDDYEVDDDEDDFDFDGDDLDAKRRIAVAASLVAPSENPSIETASAGFAVAEVESFEGASLEAEAEVIEEAPSAPAFAVSTEELAKLFADSSDEEVEPLVVESATVFPSLEVDEDELFDLAVASGETLEFAEDIEDESVELEVQSLLFPEEEPTPSVEARATSGGPAGKTDADKARSENAAAKHSGVDDDWAPWGEDSAPIRPAAVLAVQSQAAFLPDEDDADEEEDDFPELAIEIEESGEIAVTALAAEVLDLEAEIMNEGELNDSTIPEAAPAVSAIATSVDEGGDVTTSPKAGIDDDDDYDSDDDDDYDVDEADDDDDYIIDDDDDEDDEDEDDDDLDDDDDDDMTFGSLDIVEDETLDFETIAVEESGLASSGSSSSRVARPQAGPGLEFDSRFGDPLYDSAVELCLGADTCRISFLQRNLDIDFARAAALIERMEAEGLVGPYSASGHHETLVNLDTWLAGR